MKKLKPFQKTSRGGRRQVLIKSRLIAGICERVAASTGHPFQWVFDELMEMFLEGYVFGKNTHDELFRRVVEKLEQ
jgi:hypothetical protein